MNQFLGIFIFAVGIMLSIGLHEIGHLVPAKKFGVRVPSYMIGFGPTIWSKKTKETEYGVKLLPLGGFIRMIGMYPPSNNPELKIDELGRMGQLIEDSRRESLAEVTESDTNRVFYKLSVPKKITIMLGGPTMNLIISAVLFAVALSGIGAAQATTTLKALVACVPSQANPTGIASTDGSCGSGQQSPSVLAGLQAGDKLISINGTEINNWSDLPVAVQNQTGKTIPVIIERSGQQLTLQTTIASATDISDGRPFIGVAPTTEYIKLPLTQIPNEMWGMTKMSVTGLLSFPKEVLNLGKGFVSGEPRDPTGPVSVIGVGRISGQITGAEGFSAKDKVFMLLTLLASLNLFLFLFNLVPILPLDGGHVAGALYEGLRKTKARILHRPMPAPFDTAKMLPIAYVATIFILIMSVVVMLADIIKPLNFF